MTMTDDYLPDRSQNHGLRKIERECIVSRQKLIIQK